MLTENQFDILSALAEGRPGSSAQSGPDSAYLAANGYIAHGEITAAGFAALEPYRVKRAIFIAAGFGSRLVPITLNTPKPLVRVHGVRIIDSLLDAVSAAGIEDVWLVRGYLGEQFDQLLYKYPNIKFLLIIRSTTPQTTSYPWSPRAIYCKMLTCSKLISCCITRSSSRAISIIPTIWPYR